MVHLNYKLPSVLALSLFIMACQSTPAPQKKPTTTTKTASTTTQVTTRQVPVIQSKDGVQDLRWNIKTIKGKKGLFFNETPYLRLTSNNQRVQAHTGCNPVFGTYQFNLQQKTVHFDVKAGHSSCDNALAQEAELLEAFADVRYFQVNGATMQLLNQQRQVLIQADQR